VGPRRLTQSSTAIIVKSAGPSAKAARIAFQGSNTDAHNGWLVMPALVAGIYALLC